VFLASKLPFLDRADHSWAVNGRLGAILGYLFQVSLIPTNISNHGLFEAEIVAQILMIVSLYIMSLASGQNLGSRNLPILPIGLPK
jgi:hypothetical protein